MAAATISGRSSSTFARTILRSAPTRASAAAPRRPSQVSVSNGFVPSNFSLRCPTRFAPAPSPIRLVRRELSTLVPFHSAISAACLVSRLPTDANTSIQGFISPSPMSCSYAIVHGACNRIDSCWRGFHFEANHICSTLLLGVLENFHIFIWRKWVGSVVGSLLGSRIRLHLVLWCRGLNCETNLK